MHPCINRSRSNGLTLLEVTLSLAVAGIVLIGVYEIAATTFSLTGEVEQDQAEALQEEAFVQFVQRQFRQLPGRAEVSLTTKKQGRVYTSTLAIKEAPLAFHFSNTSGFSRIELRTEPLAGGDLRVYVRYFDENEAYRDLVLFRNVTDLSWRFYDPEKQTWVPTWQQETRPRRIELQLGFRGASPYRYLFYLPSVDTTSPEEPQTEPEVAAT